MANPQIENGHVDLANDIVDALAKTQLSGYETRVLWALFRKTWGWVDKTENGKIKRNKKGQPLKKQTAVIPSKTWVELTGLNKYNISRTLRQLELRQIVIKNDNNNEWGPQKDYDRWLEPIKRIVIKNDNTYFVIKNDNVFIKNDNGIIKIDNNKAPKELFIKEHRIPKETLKETLKESKHAKSAFQGSQNSKNLEKEIDKLIELYKKTFPEHIKVYKTGSIISMRDLIKLAVSRGTPLQAVRDRIQKSKTGTPREILSEQWMKEIKRPKTPQEIIEYQKKRLGWSPYEQIMEAKGG